MLSVMEWGAIVMVREVIAMGVILLGKCSLFERVVLLLGGRKRRPV